MFKPNFIFSSLVLGLILSFTSCCPEKDCVLSAPISYITIDFVGYDDADLESVKVKIFDTNSNTLLGTKQENIVSSNDVRLSELTTANYGSKEFKEYYFVLETDFSSDTISRIQYDVVETEAYCDSKCLWKKRKPTKIQRKENVTFYVNQSFYDNDSYKATVFK
jgi:hypothetical protein